MSQHIWICLSCCHNCYIHSTRRCWSPEHLGLISQVEWSQKSHQQKSPEGVKTHVAHRGRELKTQPWPGSNILSCWVKGQEKVQAWPHPVGCHSVRTGDWNHGSCRHPPSVRQPKLWEETTSKRLCHHSKTHRWWRYFSFRLQDDAERFPWQSFTNTGRLQRKQLRWCKPGFQQKSPGKPFRSTWTGSSCPWCEAEAKAFVFKKHESVTGLETLWDTKLWQKTGSSYVFLS